MHHCFRYRFFFFIFNATQPIRLIITTPSPFAARHAGVLLLCFFIIHYAATATAYAHGCFVITTSGLFHAKNYYFYYWCHDTPERRRHLLMMRLFDVHSLSAININSYYLITPLFHWPTIIHTRLLPPHNFHYLSGQLLSPPLPTIVISPPFIISQFHDHWSAIIHFHFPPFHFHHIIHYSFTFSIKQ